MQDPSFNNYIDLIIEKLFLELSEGMKTSFEKLGLKATKDKCGNYGHPEKYIPLTSLNKKAHGKHLMNFQNLLSHYSHQTKYEKQTLCRTNVNGK